jgi:hypothetical protein
LQALVKNNTVRYFSGVGGFGSSSGIGQWVQSACTVVPASAYGGSASSGSMPSGFPSGGMSGSGAAAPGSTQGPPPGFTPGGGAPSGSSGGAGFGGFGGGFGGGQQLYDCAGAVQ